MAKRTYLASSSPDHDPPSKRRHFSRSASPTTSAIPQTPQRNRRACASYSIPSDSPTNPFGRKRSVNLGLPHPTSFAKHLAFRFQLIRDGGTKRGDREGVYRIAQVPLNYTFRHLHKLLYFLFDGPAVYSPTASILDKEERTQADGHLFEAQKGVTVYSLAHKGGQIKSGKTWAKLSSVRDPYRYVEDEKSEGGDSESNGGDNESENVEWKWEAEEDLTLAHVWPHGPDLSRAIIYHHDSRTQIHMTINTSKILRRSGIGNQPFIFRARGLYSLSGEWTDDDDPHINLSTGGWNEFEAFEAFFRQFGENNDTVEDLGDITQTSIQTPGFSTSSSPGSSTPYSDPILTPFTPAPTRPRHRLRVNYAHKRLTRLVKKGIKDIDDESEEEDNVDQLADDDEEEEKESKGKKPDNWDPFGDEAEVC